jgi:N-acylglucosamine 2-epimerase (GlcNAc 2-epimerase)
VGHQFEWFLLVSGAPEVFEGLKLALYLPRAMQWARQAGVDPATQGVYASLDEHGSVRDTTQRIWAQAEYARALAVAGDWAALEKQLDFFQTRFYIRAAGMNAWIARGRWRDTICRPPRRIIWPVAIRSYPPPDSSASGYALYFHDRRSWASSFGRLSKSAPGPCAFILRCVFAFEFRPINNGALT